MRLTQVPPAANHPAVSGKHDGTDRHLAIRGGFAGQRDRRFHIIVPSHTPQCSGGHTTAPHDWSARPTCAPNRSGTNVSPWRNTLITASW